MIPLSLPCRACRLGCSSLQATSRDTLVSFTSRTSSGRRSNLQKSLYSTSSSPSRITYRIAASSSAKGRRFHPIKNAYDFDPNRDNAIGVTTENKSLSARRKLRPDSGEDAWFVSNIGQNPHQPGAVAFGVADGVGGWAESRVDPADFSHGICRYMAQAALSWTSPAEKLRPKQLMQVGYDRVVDDKDIPAGGSTASVGVGLEDGRVELANLGDSGSVLLRLAAVHHYSIPQTHSFNTPYQLSVIPPHISAQTAIFGGSFLQDFPRDAAVTNMQMQHGDVLILATDGVFDNLNNQDILKNITGRMVVTGAWTATPEVGIGVSDSLSQLTGPEGLAPFIRNSAPGTAAADTKTPTLQAVLAASVASEAKLASLDYRRDGPFAKESQRYFRGDYYHGGKVDDIAVIAVVAVDESLGAQ